MKFLRVITPRVVRLVVILVFIASTLSDSISPASASHLLVDPDSWSVSQDQYFSFQYPAGWQVQRRPEKNFVEITASSPDNLYKMSVAFDQDFVNRAGILNQCESVDQYLEAVYQARFVRYATSTAQYPYTTVTKDGFQPGFLGGKSTTVTITNVERYQKPYSNVIYMNAVPRTGGLYLMMFAHPSEAMSISENLRQRFLHSVVFAASPLPKNAYCNYLGK